MAREQAQQATPNGAATFPRERQVRLGGFTVTLPIVIEPGAVLTEQQALFYNTAWHSAAMNSYGRKFQDLKDKAAKSGQALTPKAVQAAALAHFNEYEWSPRGAGEPADPVEREVRKQARSELTLALANLPPEKGGPISLQAQDKEQANLMVDKWIAKHGDRIRKEVKARIDKAGSMLSDDLFDGVTLKTKDAPEAQASA